MHRLPRQPESSAELEQRLKLSAQRYKPSMTGADPKGQEGQKKLPLKALPMAVLLEASMGIGEGMIKYGLHNWRTSGGVETMTYVDAAQRHLMAFILGEDIDPASGISHITKAISSLMVLRDAQINGAAIDNRPPALPAGFLDQLQNQWGEVQKLAGQARAAMDAQALR